MSQIWTRIKERLKDEIEKQSYKTWIENTYAAIDDDVLICYCDNEFQRDWLEKQYKDIIFHTVKIISGQTYEIHFEVQSKNNLIESTEEKHCYFTAIDTLKKNVEELEKTIKVLENRLSKLENSI